MWGCWVGGYHRELGKRTQGLRNKSKGENSIFEKHGCSSETVPSDCSSWKQALQNVQNSGREGRIGRMRFFM